MSTEKGFMVQANKLTTLTIPLSLQIIFSCLHETLIGHRTTTITTKPFSPKQVGVG
jgi:hypothetical protein